MTAPIRHLTVPQDQLAAAVRQLAALRTLLAAREHAASPSDRLAYSLDADLITGDVPVSTDADYDGWAEHIAALEAANRQARNARKETL